MDKNSEYLRRIELLPVEGTECLQKYDYDLVIIAVFEEKEYESIRKELILQGIPGNNIVWNATRFSWD